MSYMRCRTSTVELSLKQLMIDLAYMVCRSNGCYQMKYGKIDGVAKKVLSQTILQPISMSPSCSAWRYRTRERR